MKKAKSLKILLLAAVFLLAAVMFVFSTGYKKVNAEVNLDDYFVGGMTFETDGSGDKTGNLLYKVDGEGYSFGVVNQLAVDDAEFSFGISDEIKSVKITFKSDSFDVNGNKKIEDDVTLYETEIKNVVKIERDGEDAEKFSFKLNDKTFASLITAADGQFILGVGNYDDDNYLSAKLNGNAIDGTTCGKFYKIASKQNIIADVDFDFELEDGEEEGDFVLKYINQDASDLEGKRKQTFALNEGETAFATKALPVVNMDENFLWGADLGYTQDIVAIFGREYSLTFKTYAVLGGSYSINVGDVSDGVWKANGINTVAFKSAADQTIEIKGVDGVGQNVVYADYTVKVIQAEDTEAPKYNGDADALASFKNLLNERLYADKEEGIFVVIGSGEYVNLPSFESMVSDNMVTYGQLKYTLYYWTPTTTSATASESTSLRIPIASAGTYRFYVIFEDVCGNKMTTYDFYHLSVEDNNVEHLGVYGNYIFSFTVEDNYPIEITVPEEQGTGYVGTTYTATDFTTKSSLYTKEYKLYYSATEIGKDSEGWTEIFAFSDYSDMSEEDFNEAYAGKSVSYERIKKISYNKTTTFIPDEVGFYKLECKAYINNRSETAASIIEVKEKQKEVVVDDHWLENNVWSVVFLSIGTLSLIGIIVLLFIKPKEESEVIRSEKNQDK